jgi:hypothetical protein
MKASNFLGGPKTASATVLTCAALLLTFQSGGPRTGPSKAATVSFGVVDGLGKGNLQGGAVKSFKNLETGRELAASFHLNRFLDQEAKQVPYGHYELKFDQPGFPEIARPVDVSRSKVDFDVCVRTATVHLVPVHTSSDFKADVKFFRNDQYALDLASAFKENTALSVPYGIYDLRVENRGFYTLTQQVSIFQPEVWVLIHPEFGVEQPAFPTPTITLSGTVKNLNPAEEPIYVRLINIFPTSAVSNTPVDSKLTVSGDSGKFALAGTLPGGEYALVIFGRSGVLDFRKIELTHDYAQHPVVIDLGHTH